MVIEWIKALIFGIVEGITEWLPISSTGHLILLDEFLTLDASDAFKEMFDVVIQLGAILAVVVIYWKQLWPFGKQHNPKPMAKQGFGALVKKDVLQMWCKVLVACLPAAVIGLLLDDWFHEHFYNAWVVAAMLILFGLAFIFIERWQKKLHAEDEQHRFDHLPHRTLDRRLSGNRGSLSGNIAFGRNHCRRAVARCITHCGCGIYILPGSPRNVRRESAQARQVRAALHRHGNHIAPHRHDLRVPGFCACDPLPYELHQKARFHRIRVVSHRNRHSRFHLRRGWRYWINRMKNDSKTKAVHSCKGNSCTAFYVSRVSDYRPAPDTDRGVSGAPTLPSPMENRAFRSCSKGRWKCRRAVKTSPTLRYNTDPLARSDRS